MHAVTHSEYCPTPWGTAVAPDAEDFELSDSTLPLGGTGSMWDFSRFRDWEDTLESLTPIQVIQVNVGAVVDSSSAVAPDLRTASEHLANIRKVLNPAISDLALVFGVSRQAVYKWIGGEAEPEASKFERIRSLSRAADTFKVAGVVRASTMLKMKVFEGRSLIDLAAADRLSDSHVQTLLAEAKAMEAAYDRSGLARSKAKPTDDWRSGVSIPATSER